MVTKSRVKVIVLLGILTLVGVLVSNSNVSFALSGSDNALMNPWSSNGTIWPSPSVGLGISTSIAGVNNENLYLYGCDGSVTYNWDYQNNVEQVTENPTSWIQQIVSVSTSGNSCYTIEYWPNYFNPGIPDYYSMMISPSPAFYASGGFEFSISSSCSGTTCTVNSFDLSTSYGGQNHYWTITPSQLNNDPTISFNAGSQEDFNIVGVAGGSTTTFNAGSGSIQYCSVLDSGQDGVQTGENSNMQYGSPSQSVCPNALPLYQQSFAWNSPALTVNSQNQGGQAITGYYTVLEQNGNQIGSGYTPVTFSNLGYDQTYTVFVDN